MKKVAIMVDGGFYRKRANHLFGEKSPKERVEELTHYCKLHLQQGKRQPPAELYRIFYYDCPPCDKNVFHPFTQHNVNLKKQPTYTWMVDFLNQLKSKRKLALRLGRLASTGITYVLKPNITKALFSGAKQLSEITEKDFTLNIMQKTMDMKLGTDIASITFKKQVDQIILIAGDSDFVPAAKLARREGIDFILDPMGNSINDDLSEHIDGIHSKIKYFIPKNDSSKP